MKVFKKVFAFAIALTAIAMASSAMADDAVYNDGVVRVANTLTGDTQTTLAVVDTQFGINDEDTVVDNIYYIDQDTAAVIGDKLNNGVTLLVPSNFVPSTAEVRVGGAEYAIPAFVAPTSFNKIKVEDKVGFDGTIVLNGATFNDIVFTLTTTQYPGEQFPWRASNSDVFTKTGNATINNLVGNVSFGLEIAGVSSEYDVDLVKIDVE